jgi:pyruvate kinase
LSKPSSFLNRARTKIVATVGPACGSVEKLVELIHAGAEVFRINTAHGTPEERAQKLADIRTASEQVGQPVGVLVDLAGPKIRLGELMNEPVVCDVGEEFRFVPGNKSNAPDELTCTYPTLISELAVGDAVMLADGTVSMAVVAKEQGQVRCRVTGAGQIRSRQGINLPGAKLSVASLTEADMANAIWAAKNDVDFVSLSFVRKAVDVLLLKELLKSHGSNAMTIAKIEKPEACSKLSRLWRRLRE